MLKNIVKEVLKRGIIAAALLSIFAAAAAASPRGGSEAPLFKAVSTNAVAVSLESMRGKVVILDFFATWCQPCRISIPNLVELNKKFSKQGLVTIGVSVDEDGEKVLSPFIAKYQINYPVILATDSILTDYAVRGVPIMYLIDKKGKISQIYRGYNNDIESAIAERVKKLLKEK